MLSQQLVTVSLDRIYFKKFYNFKNNFITEKQKTLDAKISSNFFDEAVRLIYNLIKFNDD